MPLTLWNSAMAILLTGQAFTSASPRNLMASMANNGGIGYRPGYAAMHSPRSKRAAGPLELPEFPARSVKRHEFGLYKRQTSNTTANATATVAANGNEDLDLVTAQSWYWGEDSAAVAPDAVGNPIVNLTGYVREDQQRYLSSERFADFIASVDCPNGQIVFTFNDQDGFGSTQDKWKWINNGNRTVIIVLEGGDCGNEKRQPYLAQDLVFNSGSRRAVFTARASTWIDSFPGYKISANSQGLLSQQSSASSSNTTSLSRRESIDTGIDISNDFSGNIFSAPDVANSSLEFNLDCKACSTTGRLDFKFDASLDLGNIFNDEDTFQASAEVKPSGVGASVELGFKLGGELTEELSFTPSLPAVTLPGGISAGPFVIGPNLVVSYLAELSSVSAEAELSLGTKITVDDAAVASVSISGEGENTFDGWTPSFEPIGPDLSASVSVSAMTGPQISVELDITVFDKGLAAGLVLAAPQLTATLSADADIAGGVCDNPDANLGATIDVGLLAEFNAFGGLSDPDDKFPNQFNLFSTSTAFFSTCATFGSSGATDAAVSTTAASVAASTTAAAPAATVTGTTSTFQTEDCTGDSGSNTWVSGSCTPAGLDEEFGSGSLTGDALDAGAGCVVKYFSDEDCTTQVGPAFAPASGQCLSAADIGDEAAGIRSVTVDC